MIDLSQIPVDITDYIQNFRFFLNLAWDHVVYKIMKDHDWDDDENLIDDWIQLNWEMLVEREILGENYTLTQFGTTHLGESLLHPMKKLDFIVIGKIKTNENDILTQKKIPEDAFLRLFSFNILVKKNILTFGPPFNLACLVDEETQNLYTVPIEKVTFKLYRYEDWREEKGSKNDIVT